MSTAHRRAGWRKSTFSAQHNGCVEVDFLADHVEIRDDKVDNSPVIRFTISQWNHWLAEIMNELNNNNGAVSITKSGTMWVVCELSSGKTLRFSEQEWSDFRSGAVAGEFTPASVLV